ncbi:hypothetical protein [Janthinobacterium sp. MDT1-19]|uniref:hypothetical protein n=1 Tax=Janthinobacterium sp. MDT1-19 TaxID=1259339 RepID=UPI003F521077
MSLCISRMEWFSPDIKEPPPWRYSTDKAANLPYVSALVTFSPRRSTAAYSPVAGSV